VVTAHTKKAAAAAFKVTYVIVHNSFIFTANIPFSLNMHMTVFMCAVIFIQITTLP